MSSVVLRVGGVPFDHWKEVSITRSIECASGSFELKGAVAPAGLANSRVTVEIDKAPVISGWVDSVISEANDKDRGCTIAGRDAAADLVDCSPLIPEFKGMGILAIARRVCKPFGIKVVAPNTPDVYGAAFETVAGHPGETVFEFLDRLAKAVGVLLWSDGLGNLVIGLPSFQALPVILERGVNLKSIRVSNDRSCQFSELRAVAQTSGGDNSYADVVAGPMALLQETRVKRYRPLTIMAEQAAEVAQLTERVKTERSIRRARGDGVEVVVSGWAVGPSMPVWPVGRSVKVRDEMLGLFDERLVIAEAEFSKGEDGETARLKLLPRSGLTRPLTPLKDDAWD